MQVAEDGERGALLARLQPLLTQELAGRSREQEGAGGGRERTARGPTALPPSGSSPPSLQAAMVGVGDHEAPALAELPASELLRMLGGRGEMDVAAAGVVAEELGAREGPQVAAAAEGLPPRVVVAAMRMAAVAGRELGGGCTTPALVGALGEGMSEARAAQLTPSAAVAALRAYATAGGASPRVAAAFEPALRAHAARFSGAELAALARAHHRMGAVRPGPLWTALAGAACEAAPRLATRDMATLLWVYADSGCAELEAAQRMFLQARQPSSLGPFSPGICPH